MEIGNGAILKNFENYETSVMVVVVVDCCEKTSQCIVKVKQVENLSSLECVTISLLQ